MDLETTLKLHRELWDWLYHNPSKGKDEWPGWSWNGGKNPYVKHHCFMCEYADCCANCPLDWNGLNCIYKNIANDSKGYYEKWRSAKSPKAKKKYAKIIRDLSLKVSYLQAGEININLVG